MSLHYRQQGPAIIIFGNTYPFRDRIKALGGKFHGPEKIWRLPMSEGALAEVAALCAGAGGGLVGEATRSVLAGDAALGRFPQSADAGEAPAAGTGEAAQLRLGAADPADAGAAAQPRAAGTVRGATFLPTGGDSDSLTIRQVMERLGLAVSAAFPTAVWVVGEIQNFAKRNSNVFFDLAESREGAHANATMTVRAIIWSSALQSIATRRGAERTAEILADGMQVRCRCQVQIYKDRGSVTLVIEDIDPAYTKGALALAREKLLKELRAKGLDGANKKLPLPPFPFRVGLISAPGSRAKSDFLDQLASLGFPGDVLFCAAAMQGESVPGLVVRALTRLIGAGCDLIVLTRGGGSAADLRWFDAAEIAYAIAACPVPVIAAIGHHDDVCVAEEICHLRQKTPTAAADFVAGCFVRTREAVDTLAASLARLLGRRVEELGLVAATLSAQLAGSALRATTARDGRLVQRAQLLNSTALARVADGNGRLAQRAATLATSAAARLADGNGRLAQRAATLATSAAARLADGNGRLAQRAATLATSAAARLADGNGRLVQRAQALATSAAARIVDGVGRLAQRAQTLAASSSARVAEAEAQLAPQAMALRTGAQARVLGNEGRLATGTTALGVAGERALAERQVGVETLAAGLAGHDPKPWMTAGWTRLAGPRGPVRRVAEAKVGDDMNIRLLDGWLTLRVVGLGGGAAKKREDGDKA